MNSNWKTWSPFQSPEVRQICEHMTDAERRQVGLRGGIYGIWVGATLAGPIATTMLYPNPTMLVVAAIVVTAHIACIPIWQRSIRRFLCSTAWASERGFKPEQLRLFSFQNK